ncbi:MAG: hypothetical protein KBH99_01165 [Syntrophobacteraceae bacterium]|nr:hypothetical protein [Syntrophobacteraceae bacterium]
MSTIGDLLEKTCKDVIQTILCCIDHATKGTIYRIGPMPQLRAIRVTSGIRSDGTDQIQWGLPSVSDYNFPGKSWEQYRDRPDHVLEAMGWCVEQQKSWTAENPFEDMRSVSKQLRGEIEDFYHMEPVLVRKIDLYGGCRDRIEYPKDWRGNPIWQNSDYLVAAVIKIHFKPYTLKRGDRSTRIIKELSRRLGTEILSLNLRENLFQAQKEFTRRRLQSCEILAHEMRNALIKFGFIVSAINAQMGILRGHWEDHLRRIFPHLEWKESILGRLNELLSKRLPELDENPARKKLGRILIGEQTEFAALQLLPAQGEQWVRYKIRPKWERLLSEQAVWGKDAEEIRELLDRLGKSLWFGMDEELLEQAEIIPRELRSKWPRLLYKYYSAEELPSLVEVLQLLEHPNLPVPHKLQIRKVLNCLKSMAEVVPEMEERANRILLSAKNGEPVDMPAFEAWGLCQDSLASACRHADADEMISVSK